MPSADFIEQRSNSDSDDSLTTAKSSGKGRGRHPNSLANLKIKPFPKGVSGNPGGKPRVDVSAIIARAILEENSEAVYQALAKALCRGNAYVYKELSDRAYGKVNTPVTVEAGDQLASILMQGRERAANRGNTALTAPALPAITPAPALPQVVEIVPSPPAPVAPVAATPKPVVVAKPAPPAPTLKPVTDLLSAEDQNKRFFDYTTGKCIKG
jgi:hypothetical protein